MFNTSHAVTLPFTPTGRSLESPCTSGFPQPGVQGFFYPRTSQHLIGSVRLMGMPRPELSSTERRDQPINALVTKRERAAVDRVAAQLGMSRSNAARYLMNLGLAEFSFTPSEETES